MANQKLRWGILSTAKIGRRTVIPAIQHSRNGVVTAIASRDVRTAQAAANELHIPHAFGSYEALLASPEIDAVYIPLPNHLHKEWTIRAAHAGKHILCEKPFALNAGEVEEMIAAAKQHHVVLMEAFMYRFHPQFARVKKMIADGALGKLETIRSEFCYFLDRPGDIRRNATMGGGALYDVGCYNVNMARLIAGTEPLSAQAHAVFGTETHVDEKMTGLLRFPNDVLAVFDCGFVTSYLERLDIHGSRGRIEIVRPIKPGNTPAQIILHHADDSRETITAPAANHYQLMCEHFADAVLNHTPLLYPPELDINNMHVIDMLYASVKK